MINNPFAYEPAVRPPAIISDADMAALLDDIYHHHHHDFRGYAETSLRRRLDCAMRKFQVSTVVELRLRLQEDVRVFPSLLQYMTVPVSAMFRDPSYYCALRRDVLPLLKTYSAPKIWVAGCSTGEEAYSIAILLHEEGMLEQSLIYATDINPLVLKTAMQGIFPVARLQTYTQHYQAAGGKAAFSDYYHAAYGHAVFSRHLGRRIVFAEHSLATDAVFSEMQFISCRNVLIYFKRDLQQRTLGMFADALCHRGFLGLGSRETTGITSTCSRFEPWVKTAKIYRKLIEFHPGSGFK